MESLQHASPHFKNKEKRQGLNKKVLDFNQAYEETHSVRAAAKSAGIPRSTARYHAQRQQECTWDSDVSAFFRTVSGSAFLHQLVLAIEFVLSQLGHCGLRLIQRIYELSGLDQAVACSIGKLSERVKQIETTLIDYGEQQETRLSEAVSTDKAITCCVDETFPSGTCLVGMEPVSNYILLEEMAAKRDTATWAKAMDRRLRNLPVKVIQVTSDEAKALIKLTQQHLGAHHSPDLFHVQQEVSKASAAPLKAKIKKAQSAVDQAAGDLETLKEQQAAYERNEQKPVGRPRDYVGRQANAEVEHEFAIKELEVAECRRDTVQETNRSLGEIYHPFDPNTGQPRKPAQLRRKLDDAFDVIETTLQDAELSENSLKRIEKARRVTEAMVDTLKFFWIMVSNQVKSLALKGIQKKLFLEQLLPVRYLEIHAAKAGTAEIRQQRMAGAKKLFDQLEQDSYWQSLPEEQKQHLDMEATECAHLFQRSSSNVEGRNGQLALRHHAYKRLGKRKLRAATVIHNYFIQRSDGTTAAERLFGKAPEPLFKHLLMVTDYPAAPAKSRSVVRKLNAAA